MGEGMRKRLVGIDVGEKSVGIAATDRTKTLISPHEAIVYNKKDFPVETVVKQIRELEAETVVMGHPLGVDGKPTDQTKIVEKIYGLLSKSMPEIRWVLQDERYSTWAVLRKYGKKGLLMKQQKQMALKRKNMVGTVGKENIDSFAAMEILEDYMGYASIDCIERRT